MERQLIADYETMVGKILGGLNENNYHQAVGLAQIPEHIRGFGHVKERHLIEAKKKESELLAAFKTPTQPAKLAA